LESQEEAWVLARKERAKADYRHKERLCAIMSNNAPNPSNELAPFGGFFRESVALKNDLEFFRMAE
jgi:hypothetical protein